MFYRLSNHVELIKPTPNSTNIQRDRNFAKMAFGDDIHDVGGIEQEVRFQKLYDTSNCGKMKTRKFKMGWRYFLKFKKIFLNIVSERFLYLSH